MKEIDWEQRRYEITKDMFPLIYKETWDKYHNASHCDLPYIKTSNNDIASKAVSIADAIIEELKEGK